MRVNVVCDFDGTIALEDVTDSLLDRFADPAWKQVEAQWLAGQFGSRECMARQVSLIEASYERLDRYLDTVEIDPSFPSFVDECERRGNVALNVVSDGIDYAVRRILGNHELSRLRVKANALVAVSDRTYRLDFPYFAPDCSARAGNCKCAIARNLSRPSPSYSPTILIGDGASDFCIASQVDFVFAKDRLLAHCQANAIAHLPFSNFFDIERELPHVVGALRRLIQSASPITETPE
jgi:2-hydroxy-3-keto-5-methylthiopentenyl-1-phosphate phosphatase